MFELLLLITESILHSIPVLDIFLFYAQIIRKHECSGTGHSQDKIDLFYFSVLSQIVKAHCVTLNPTVLPTISSINNGEMASWLFLPCGAFLRWISYEVAGLVSAVCSGTNICHIPPYCSAWLLALCAKPSVFSPLLQLCSLGVQTKTCQLEHYESI